MSKGPKLKLKTEKPVKGLSKHKTGTKGLRRTNVTNGWIPQGEFVEVAGRTIPGMVYICNSNEIEVSEDDHTGSTSCIDMAKPVSGSDMLGNLLTTRKYADMAPECRASYLDWLANGKKDRNCCPEYVMTYFFGLERRMILDFPNRDESQLWDEFERLEKVFKFNDELNFCINRMYSYIILVSYLTENDLDFPNEFAPYPIEFHLEINDMLRKGRALTGNLIFQWFNFDCDLGIRNTMAAPGMKEAFVRKFNELHPNGLKLDCPNKDFKLVYTSQTGDFSASREIDVNGLPLLDIREMEPVMTMGKVILDSIIRSRMTRNSGQSDSPTPSGSLEFPTGLKIDNFDEPVDFGIDAEGFSEWAEPLADKATPVKFGDMLDRLGFVMRTDTGEFDRLAITGIIGAMGFGIAPHWILNFPEPASTDSVHLYKTKTNHHNRDGSEIFEQAIISLGVGACLYSHVKCSPSEVGTALRKAVSSWDNLNQSDLPGIHANIHYLQRNLPDGKFFNRLLEANPEGMMKEIRSIAVALAMAFNAGRSKKTAMMEALYKSLKLDAKLANEDLQTGGPHPAYQDWENNTGNSIN